MQEIILQKRLRFIVLPCIERIEPPTFAFRVVVFVNGRDINGEARLEAIFRHSAPMINADGQRPKSLYGHHRKSVAKNDLASGRFLPRLNDALFDMPTE